MTINIMIKIIIRGNCKLSKYIKKLNGVLRGYGLNKG